jgi:pyruvate dehydrogenase E1 component beta subunit
MQTRTVREAVRDAIKEEMERDDLVFIIGEEVGEYQGAYKCTQGLLDHFGSKRVIDAPISEYGFAGLAVGAAFAGLKPIVEFMTFNFAMQAMDHIINSAAKTLYMSGGNIACPIVFRGPNGAALGVGAQHSQNYSAWFSHIPGLKVVTPYCAQDTNLLLRGAISDPNPVIVLENEVLYSQSFEDDPDFVALPMNQARIRRVGSDLTIIAFSRQVGMALEASEILSKDRGISAEVIDVRSLRPLDHTTICNSVKKTNRAVVIEEGWFYGGIGSTISSLIMKEVFDYLDAPVEIVSGEDVPLPYAANLEKLALPSVEKILAASKKVTYAG